MKLGTIIRKELLQLFFIVLAFGLMVAVSYYFVSDIVEKQIFVTAQETLNTAEVAIRSDLRDAETALLQVELLIENWILWGASRDEIRSNLVALAGSMYSDSAWISGILNVYGIVNDDFISGLYTLSEGFVPENRPWYHAAEAADGKIGITSPYIDNKLKIPVISFTKIMRNKEGKRFGTIALDIDFSVLSDYIESLHFKHGQNISGNTGGFGILLDENCYIIAHPSNDYINKPVAEISLEYAELIEEVKNKPNSISTMRMTNTEGVPVVLISKQIFNGWYLGIATPVASYYHDIKSMAITLSALGVFFMIILGIILVRLSILKAHSDEENMEKSSFLARMSHEIRTPLNSILGMAELIQRKEVSGEIQEYVEIIHQSGDSLLSIINDILDFSKIGSGKLQIQERDYYIASVINDTINIFRPRVVEKSLDFLVNIDSTIPAHLYGDDIRLRQIMANLLSNAVKYTRKGSISLDIGMERMEDNSIKLNCVVSDTGAGIKIEDQGNIFKEFSRLDVKANLGIEGTGLGLVISKVLARAMGGDVTFTSEYGKGSVFRASIVQKFNNSVPVARVFNPENKRVLFYDWREVYVKSIINTFTNLGIDYYCASSLQEFITSLEQDDFDYAFISSKFAMDCIYVLAKGDNPLQMVIMVEPGETSVYHEVPSILMPVYSVSVANVLNNISEGINPNDIKLRLQFTAPSAKVLIVDDISTNLRVAKELMVPYGMSIHTSLSGSDALEQVRNNIYDIVFMDHMMPGMDGIEATARIRGIDTDNVYYRDLPIVALTANAIYGQREMFLEHGINDFLAKPIDIQKLNDILVRWLPPDKIIDIVELQEVEAVPDEPEVMEISGVDTAKGLINCGGDTRVYYSILTDFCQDAEVRLLEIADAVTKGDNKLYVTVVHALKGAARSIGALETGDKAFYLEKVGATGNLESTRERTTDLFNNVRVLIKNIRAAVERNNAENVKDYKDIPSLGLGTLKTALADMNIEAVNKILLEYAALPLDSKTKELISEVEQLILMFEYDKAIEKINEFF